VLASSFEPPVKVWVRLAPELQVTPALERLPVTKVTLPPPAGPVKTPPLPKAVVAVLLSAGRLPGVMVVVRPVKMRS